MCLLKRCQCPPLMMCNEFPRYASTLPKNILFVCFNWLLKEIPAQSYSNEVLSFIHEKTRRHRIQVNLLSILSMNKKYNQCTYHFLFPLNYLSHLGREFHHKHLSQCAHHHQTDCSLGLKSNGICFLGLPSTVIVRHGLKDPLRLVYQGDSSKLNNDQTVFCLTKCL